MWKQSSYLKLLKSSAFPTHLSESREGSFLFLVVVDIIFHKFPLQKQRNIGRYSGLTFKILQLFTFKMFLVCARTAHIFKYPRTQKT